MPSSPPTSTPHAPSAQSFKLVDPTPGEGDVTSFEQAREAARAPEAPDSSQSSETPAAPARETDLSQPRDPNRANVIPETVWGDLEKMATLDRNGMRTETAREPAKPVEQFAEKPVEESNNQPSDRSSDVEIEADLEKQVQAFKTLKEVRTAHKEALKRERAWKTEQEALNKRIAESETRLKEFNPDVIQATTKELEAARKRAEELEAQVRVLDYTKSGEFHERHVKPLAKALEAAYADLGEMSVSLEDGTSRKASEADFKKLLSMPAQEAGEMAERLFGKFAGGELMSHRRAVLGLERAKREAVENASKASEEARVRETLEQTQRVEKAQAMLKTRHAELESKFPELFKPREGDEEGNQLLSKGREMVKQLEASHLTDAERINLAAEIQYRAASFGRLFRDNRVLRQRLDEANAKLKSFEKSAPDRGDGSRNGAAVESSDPWEKAGRQLESLAKPMR